MRSCLALRAFALMRKGRAGWAGTAVESQRRAGEEAPVLVLGGVTMVGHAAMDMYLPGLPELARDFGVSTSAAQVTVATYTIGLAAGQLVAQPSTTFMVGGDP